jgi:nicotinamide-nucleotide amidase
MPSPLLIKCSQLLTEKELTLATAESATAGRLCAELALIPNCGKVLKGGVVCYDACIKQDVLGVPSELVEQYTPESAEVTAELAKRLKHFMKADIQVAITGLPMPGGSESEEKPVGTMFINILLKGEPVAIRQVFNGTPEEVVLQTIDRVAQELINRLS